MPEVFRLYLDQMIQRFVRDELVRIGHDVLRASDCGQSRCDDRLILEKAKSEKRVLVTLDDHFGDWAVLPLYRHSGVLRIKTKPTISENILNILSPFLSRNAPEAVVAHLIILSFYKEKWIFTGGLRKHEA